MDVVRKIEVVRTDDGDHPINDVIISDCGVLSDPFTPYDETATGVQV